MSIKDRLRHPGASHTTQTTQTGQTSQTSQTGQTHPTPAQQPPPPPPATQGTHVRGAHVDPAAVPEEERRAHDERVIAADRNQRAHDEFGGVNIGAAFFGWLVAVAMAVLLSSIVGALAAAVDATTNLTQDDVQREAGAVSLGAAIAVVLVLLVSYYTGGYVAGRMSRFDGGRQGLAVWVIGLVVTLIAVGLGALFGDQYNVMDRVDLPRFPVPTDAATWGGLITAAVIVIGTLLAAMTGGKVGHRYHDKVDRAAYRTPR